MPTHKLTKKKVQVPARDISASVKIELSCTILNKNILIKFQITKGLYGNISNPGHHVLFVKPGKHQVS